MPQNSRQNSYHEIAQSTSWLRHCANAEKTTAEKGRAIAQSTSWLRVAQKKTRNHTHLKVCKGHCAYRGVRQWGSPRPKAAGVALPGFAATPLPNSRSTTPPYPQKKERIAQ